MMRFEYGETTYLGEDWGGMAELVSWDGEFPFEGLPEATLTRLYEAGCWWSDAKLMVRPGVQRLVAGVSDGRLPYVLHQRLVGDDEDEVGDYAALESHLLGGAADARRARKMLYLDAGDGCVPLWYGGTTLGVLCRHAHDQVVGGRLRVERFPPLLLEMARRSRADLMSVFSEAFRSSVGVGVGTCIHRVVGCEDAYVVSRVPGALPFLRSLGLLVREGENLAGIIHGMGFGESTDTKLMADLVVCSGILGDGAVVQGANAVSRFSHRALDIQLRITSEFCSEVGEEGFFLFCGNPAEAGASAILDRVRSGL